MLETFPAVCVKLKLQFMEWKIAEERFCQISSKHSKKSLKRHLGGIVHVDRLKSNEAIDAKKIKEERREKKVGKVLGREGGCVGRHE